MELLNFDDPLPLCLLPKVDENSSCRTFDSIMLTVMIVRCKRNGAVYRIKARSAYNGL